MTSMRSIEPVFSRVARWFFAAATLVALAAPSIWAQSSQGTVSVTVIDPGGAAVPGANLELRDLGTNDLRSATSTDAGTYRFVNLNNGNLTPFVQHLNTTKGLVYVDASGSPTQLPLNGSASSPTTTTSGGSSNTGLIVAIIVLALAVLGGGAYWQMRRGGTAS